MAKLHEALAIHKDRAGVVKKVLEEARGVFKTAAHFQGHVKTLTYFKAEENEKFGKVEEKKVDETVTGKLDYLNGHLVKLLDLEYQVDKANLVATADLVLSGFVVAQQVPVATLLTLEAKLKEYRSVLDMVPTHQPGVEWEVDADQSSGGEILRSRGLVTEYLTKKIAVHDVVVPATEHHPAQVASHHDDVRVAKVDTLRYTATISPAEKSDLLGRCDTIIQAAKRARQRANSVNLPRGRIAQPLLDYIVTGNLPDGTVAPSEEGEQI